MSRCTALCLLLLLMPPAAAWAAEPTLGQLRLLGSHNSYRPQLRPVDLARQRAVLGKDSAAVEYGHPAIAQQLDLGLRQLEFDPWADHAGGRFASPYANRPVQHALMMQPGAKVLHKAEVDTRTLCLRLADCFAQVSDWSRHHPGHGLIVIWVNPKDGGPGTDEPGYEPFDEAALADVDATALKVFGRAGLLMPDDVRGDAPSLREAVTTRGWPSIRATGDRFLLVLDASDGVEQAYRQNHPSLAGRVMFGLYDESQPEAAVLNLQDPVTEQGHIRTAVALGFLVRTRSDSATVEARAHDYRRLRAALRSGAQIISTDYYRGAPDPLGLHFVVSLPTP